MKDLLSGFEYYWDAYKLEVVVLVFGIVLCQSIWRFIKRKQGPDLKSTQKKNICIVKLNYKPVWIMLITTSLMFIVFGYVAISTYNSPDYRQTLFEFIATSLALLLIIDLGRKELSVVKSEKGLVINNSIYRANELAQVELWDDLVYLKTIKEKEIKIWLIYKKEHFADIVKAMNLIEQFCTDNQVALAVHFDTDVNTNTTINKLAAPPKSLKERWEEFKKIPPYEKLPD